MPNSIADLPKVYSTRQTPHGFEKTELEHHYSARLLARECQKLGIIFEEIPGSRVYSLTYNGITRHIHSLMPVQTSELAFHVCRDKVATKAFLEPQGISMAPGFHLTREDDKAYQLEVFQKLSKPLVVKPAEGKEGSLVFMGIDTEEKFLAAVKEAFTFNADKLARVMVEETRKGTEYRVYATRDKVMAVANREPANVVGDGVSSIARLIELKNADPRRHESPQAPATKIRVDQHVTDYLQQQGITLETIPENDVKIYLRQNSNISTGGDSIDCTEIAHQSVKDICVKIVNSVPGLCLAGIDFMTTDITAQQTVDMYTIIEINSFPGLDIHEFPYVGESQPVAREILHILFPELPRESTAS